MQNIVLKRVYKIPVFVYLLLSGVFLDAALTMKNRVCYSSPIRG